MRAVTLKVGVTGAGAIGCFLGGCLAYEGVDVRFVGRPRLRDALLVSGFRFFADALWAKLQEQPGFDRPPS